MYQSKLFVMPSVAMDNEKEKQHTLQEIDRVYQEIDKAQGLPSTSSLRLDELKTELLKLYRHYTNLVNAY